MSIQKQAFIQGYMLKESACGSKHKKKKKKKKPYQNKEASPQVVDALMSNPVNAAIIKSHPYYRAVEAKKRRQRKTVSPEEIAQLKAMYGDKIGPHFKK